MSEREIYIIRQSSLKIAADLLIHDQIPDVEPGKKLSTLIGVAEILTKYVINGIDGEKA
tara:strand:- start:1089 stop:1265 length:177 start_codon:yes stop_codon:yes gene_type:complete